MPLLKLTDQDAAKREMLGLYRKGWTLREIAEAFEVSYQRVYQIISDDPRYKPTKKQGKARLGDVK